MTAVTAARKPLSYTKLAKYEACPLSFRLHYVDGHRGEAGQPLRFGKLLHAVLEQLVREHMEQERKEPLSAERAEELYQELWGVSGLSGLELYREGSSLLRQFVRQQGIVDHRDILAVEREFAIPIGEFTVIGVIDRVDWVDDETVEVLDYKSNRLLFTREEVDDSLQLSLYDLAARQLWPWAKRVKLAFHMLRHGVRMETERSPEQLEATRAYVVSLGRQLETATEFPSVLGPNCCWCDHRDRCPAYADALKGKHGFVCEDLTDLEAVAREREEVAAVAKAAYARKSELESILKSHLKGRDELLLGGVAYRMFNVSSATYPPGPTLRLLTDTTGLPLEELVEKVVSVDKKALEGLLKECEGRMERSRVLLLKAELEAKAKRTHTARFWAKKTEARS